MNIATNVVTDITDDAANPTPVLQISGVSVEYPRYGQGPHRALDAIDLHIRAGEMVGLVGETGAGKTLLARTILGNIPGDGVLAGGTMRYRGQSTERIASDDSPVRPGRDIALIVSNPRQELNPVLTVGAQIVNVIRQHLGLPRDQAHQRALKMLQAVAIPDPARRMQAWPHELSGGMAQRVVIAIALACNPGLVISDDSTSALDVTVQLQVLQLLRDMVRDQGVAGLFITRDIAITAHFSDRLVILHQGEIVEEAPTRAFFARPQHPYSILLLAAFSHSPELRALWTATPLPDGTQAACRFADRCVRRQARCLTEAPALRPTAAGRRVRCHYPVEDEL